MMMGCRMLLGKVVCVVVFAQFPIDAELILLQAATDPVKAHVYGLGLALFDGVVGNAAGGRVVCFDWSIGLRMTHVQEGLMDGTDFLVIVEEASKSALAALAISLCKILLPMWMALFSGARRVRRWHCRGLVAEVESRANVRPGFWFQQV
jgi:hypothetical protein